MDYRRRYLRRLANQSQLNQDEEKTVPEKKGENRNMQNVYLQKLLEKSNSPSGSTINSYSVKDIFSTEDNRQKQIKYVMKREDKYGQRSPLNTNNNQEETNTKSYKNIRYTHNGVSQNELNQDEKNNNIIYKTNTESRLYPHYTRRIKDNENTPYNNNNQDNQNENNDKKEENTGFLRKRFQVSASTTNLSNNIRENEQITNNTCKRRFRHNNAITHNNSPNNSKPQSKDKDKDNQPTKHRYLRGFNKNENDEENIKEEEERKEENRQNDKNINKAGYNMPSTKVEERNDYNKIKDNISSNKNLYNNLNDYSSKRYTYVRQRYKFGDIFEKKSNKKNEKKKEIVKENVIEIKIIPNIDDYNTSSKRKYGRYPSSNEKENLSFKDEKELVDYLKRKYDQNNIVGLFNIKMSDKEKKNYENEINDLKHKLEEENKKNKENEKKCVKLELNLVEKNKEINNQNKDIRDKLKEIDKLKNESSSFKKKLQEQEKENYKLKNELDNKKRNENNAEIKKIKDELNKLKIEHDKILRENEKYKKDYDALAKENELNKKDYNDLLKDYEDLENEQNEQYKSENQELIRIQNDLQDALAEKEKINEENMYNIQQIEQLENELNILKNEKREIGQNLNNIDKTNLEQDNIINENEILKKEVDNLKNEINKNNEEYNKIKNENDILKNDISILANLNNKLKEENIKIKDESSNNNTSGNINNNSKQNQDLLKIKDKYYKLLDDYKQLTDDCNILRDEKTLIQLEKKQLMIDYKRSQEESQKLNDNNNKLKEENEKLLKDIEVLKNSNKNNTQQTTKVTILKNTNNNIIISKSNQKELDIKKEDNPLNKSLVVQNIKNLDFDFARAQDYKDDKQKLNEIKNLISINEIINKINSNIGSDSNSNSNNIEKSEVSITFNITNDNISGSGKKIIDEENKELNKDIELIKNNQNEEGVFTNKLNQSNEVKNLIKEFENNMEKKTETYTGEEVDINKNNINIIYENVVDNNNNGVNVLENQELSESIKKVDEGELN